MTPAPIAPVRSSVRRPALRRASLLIATGLYLAGLLYLTLFAFRVPRLPLSAGLNLRPFASIVHDLRHGGRPFVLNLLGNVAAFAPAGVLLPALRARPTSAGRVAATCLGLSLMIESAQLASRGRVADVDDLALNVLGGLVGFWGWTLARQARECVRPSGS